jgi:uncharacterized membrane protein YgdD (TMEM256/DUF423 family)
MCSNNQRNQRFHIDLNLPQLDRLTCAAPALKLPHSHSPGIIPMARLFLMIGACNGFLTVALGAFAAHALRPQIAPDLYSVFQTGVEYHSIHALALLALGILALHHPSRALYWSGWLMGVGILLFCGSLYLLALTGSRSLGIITPFGGVALLLGWLSLIIAIRQLRPSAE